MLTPHEWDDDANRRLIHQTFDKWFAAFHSGNLQQAGRFQRELRMLCASADVRRAILSPDEMIRRELYAQRPDLWAHLNEACA